MDEGPFRASRPADRRTTGRSEPAYRQQPEEQQPRQEPQPENQAPSTRHASSKKKPLKRFKLPIVLVAILIVGVIGLLVWNGMNKNAGMSIDTNKHQAVFLTSGQVYFGKLSVANDKYLKLVDVYYLETQSADSAGTNPQEVSNTQNEVALIKLGEEGRQVHGPEDEMMISQDQVWFYENIKADGKVGEAIEAYKKSHQ